MGKRFAKFIFWILGWRLNADIPKETQRCVILASPHTSNWDIFYARLGFYIMNIPLRFTIKQEWLRFPFGLLIKPFGGLGIDRRPRKSTGERPSYIELMAELFEQHDELAMMITPEGTRALREQWKTGFYFVAQKAGVPICLGYLDYEKKEAGVGGVIYPSGDMDADLKKIMAFYAPIKGKYPSKFSVDHRYR
jgi:1-acyl-sn-glycerol-3-phosphate acyltransferase